MSEQCKCPASVHPHLRSEHDPDCNGNLPCGVCTRCITETCRCSDYPHYKSEHENDCDGGPFCGSCTRCLIMQYEWYERMEQEKHA